ncbi:peptidoglycan-binding protein [uncultured Stenotrophomonas sp.]|uniref:peptidoglycan-binding protein n=1 Tax=uncultured Stenotrophomonas sp. TaxID=165438 RepID=UPI0025D7DF82|nr:peptidoglycan-binding protein [uncultured Stenotrophomonas sp.]
MAQHDYSRKEVLDIVEQVARHKGIPVDDFMRFAYIETGGTFNERAHNASSGAKGLFQFVPGSARQYHLTGHEFDPTRNTEAAAQMYQDNLESMARRNERTGHPYLSGGAVPTGLDLYLAHQQGSAGYGSVQTAIATGTFGVVRNSQGEEINMRRNVLNQIGSDAKALTGHTLAEMRGMNDGELARTFSSYYIHKYAAISIPEKHIAPQTVAQGQGAPTPAQAAAVGAAAATLAATATAAATPKPGIELHAAYEAGVQYDHVKYAINIPGHALYVPGKTGKNVEQGYIDCSGWVGTLQNRTMDEINQKAGHAVFSKADRIDLGNLGSGGIVRKAFDQSGVLLERDAILQPGALKEGMIIGLDTARTRHEHWNGIDHIVMVVRDPNTDTLLISQSTGSKGVHTLPVEDYLKQVKDHPNWKLYASDPLSRARDLLENRTPSHEQTQGRPAAEHKAAAAPHAEPYKPGAQGEGVRRVQEQLGHLGYAGADGRPLVEDGRFGRNTEAAVRQLQKDNGLVADGIVGAKTLSALAEARERPLLNDERHPRNALFIQASKGLELMPAGTFKDRHALESTAAALTREAHAAGLQRIDAVVPSPNGERLFAVQGTLGDPAASRAAVETRTASEQSLALSSGAVQGAPNVLQAQQDAQQEQARQAHKAMGV